MKYLRWSALVCCVVVMTSCVESPEIGSSINGPRPIMQATRVSASTTNYLSVRDTFIRRAVDTGKSSTDWYQVARAGFGYVDEQCSDYLGKLRDIRIARDTARAQFASFQNTSNAVLGIVGASKLAIGVTAAAFGLASQVSDNATMNLLYAMDPADIQGLIDSQTQEYRRIAEQQRATFIDSNVAMDSIRGYLNICLPVSIEGQVKAAVRNTTFIASVSSPGVTTLTQVSTGSAVIPAIEELRNRGSTRVKPNVTENNIAGGLVAGDVRIQKDEAAVIQGNLCVKPTGNLGGIGSDTRKAIIEFQNATAATSGDSQAIAPTGLLDKVTRVKALNLAPCVTSQHKTVFEHINLVTPAQVTTAQKLLAQFAKDPNNGFGTDVTALIDDKFTSGEVLTDNNRKVIRLAEDKLKLQVTGAYTAQLESKLLLLYH
ncbi:hypothetical protein [Rhizobium leguminosarum]|uniref:Uncharacterized protein n=1 Tax=Rhizobium leguminosarum TaxID=384 RepID=A0A7K3VEH9_RHILE|nr:hypothetical protein [Rhizobium leguminosarum]NEK15028.1 hypothetical protein [Rhizobium leguminosarum]